MNIKISDVVLEIGSGNNPHPRSDILCDRYLDDNQQRAGGFAIVIDRPLVIASGYRLPFKDKAFDYVICSHILEHLKDPVAFAKEVSRVAKAGYVEVPSATSERLFGWNFHLWHCRLKAGTLILNPKKAGEQYGGFFHRLIASTVWFRRFFEEHENIFYLKYEWENTLALTVATDPLSTAQLNSLDRFLDKQLQNAFPNSQKDLKFYLGWMMRRLAKKSRKIMRKLGWTAITLVDTQTNYHRLERYLQCPACAKGSLRKLDYELHCTKCQQKYALDKTIPILLVSTERHKGY